jgi:two-component system nitrate/nitrite response regulator NarL
VDAGQLDRQVTIAVIDDLPVVVTGVRTWIASDPRNRVAIVASGDSIEEVIAGPGRNADVLVLDLELGENPEDPESGKQWATDRVAELSAEGFRVVVFSIHVEPLTIRAVMEAGACAFLDKGAEPEQFVDTIVAVAQDQPFVTPSMAGGMLHAVQLSGREREALQYRFQGMSLDSIARRLRRADGQPISNATVKDYIERARAKFAAAGHPCRSNYALLARCIELGLIRPEEIKDYHPGQFGI